MADGNVIDESQEEFSNRPIRRDMQPMDFSKMERMILFDLKSYPYLFDHRFIGKYNRDDIKNFLLAPEVWNNQVQLRYISKYLYNVSSHYKRLVQYFGGMLTFNYVIEPYNLDVDKARSNIDKFKKQYMKSVNLVEMMNIKHEFAKILNTAFRDDVYYGYVHMGSNSFFFQELNADFCKISSTEDGTYNFAFDFNYFSVYPMRLQYYPQEFKDKYNAFKKDGSLRWQELDSENTICIKVNENIDYYPIPPFVGIFGNLLEIEDFKELRKTRVEIGNYKLITQQIPVREDSDDNNDYIITLDQAIKFHNNIAGVLPQQIGLATTPMKLDIIDFERDRPDENKVADAESEYWSAAGVSQLLFTGDSGSIAMDYSIKADEMIAFQVLRQLERWLNRFLKVKGSSTYKFRVQMLEMTYFNADTFLENLISLAQYGMPLKTRIAGALGMSPSAIQNMLFLENDVLGLHESLVPMMSSHTQSGDSTDSGGRPQKKVKDLSPEGSKTRDKKKNDDRAKGR